jgi:hypothetical protein
MSVKAVYTCGRLHKQRKQQLSAKSTGVKAVVDAVLKVMREELGSAACDRWCVRLNTELGSKCFGPHGGAAEAEAAPPVPRVWVPSKPKLALALLDEFCHAFKNCAEEPRKVSLGANGSISKVLARHVVERLRDAKGAEWLQACGELNDDQINDPVKLSMTLSRAAFDLLVYIHARAKDMKQEGEENAVLDLHSSDQTLVGKAMRGCGVVFCEVGRAVFVRAAESVRDGMVA